MEICEGTRVSWNGSSCMAIAPSISHEVYAAQGRAEDKASYQTV